MNTEKITSDKEEVLKIVNEDWPMLEELGKKRFVNNKNKTKDVQDSLNVLQAVLDEDKKLSEEMKKYVLQSEYDDDKELLTKQFKEEIIPDMTRKLMSHDGMIATTAELVNKHETNLREENKMLKDKISQMETKITETYNYMQSKGMDFADLESEVERQRRLLLILAGDHVRKQFVREY